MARANWEMLAPRCVRKSCQLKKAMIRLKFKQYRTLLSKQNKDTATKKAC